MSDRSYLGLALIFVPVALIALSQINEDWTHALTRWVSAHIGRGQIVSSLLIVWGAIAIGIVGLWLVIKSPK